MSMLREDTIAQERNAWQDFNELCSKVAQDRWREPGVTDQWSPRDVVAHVACWAAEACRQLECIRSGEPSRLPEVETFNRESHEACKDLSVTEVLAMSAGAHHRLNEELQLVAPVALNAKVLEMVRECSTRHYGEHAGQLRRFLGIAQ